MFQTRLAAGLAAIFLMTDGFFLVDSRIAVIDIIYLTLAAISYLLLFRFIQLRDRARAAITLLFLGIYARPMPRFQTLRSGGNLSAGDGFPDLCDWHVRKVSVSRPCGSSLIRKSPGR